LVYFRDPLPYKPGSYHKTTFVIENNVSSLKYQINIVRQKKTSLVEHKWYIIWRVPGFVFLLLRICRAPKPHEDPTLIHQNRKFYTIYNRDRCTIFNNWRQTTTMYMYLRGGSRHFHALFISETIFFFKYQKIPRRNSKRKLQDMVKRKMTRTKLEIFC
jgi:hypothetical protein